MILALIDTMLSYVCGLGQIILYTFCERRGS